MPEYNNAIRTKQIPVQDLVPHKSSTAPASPVTGQLWVDTSVTPNRLKVWENGAWVLTSQTGAELQTNKGSASGYASLDASTKVPIAQLPTGTTATTVTIGNDARLSDSRPPNGAAGGSLAGSYPNPTIAASAVTHTEVAAANKDGIAATPSMRTLGTGAQQAAAGNHGHALTDANITGVLPIAQVPTGQTGTTVPLGNDARFTDERVPTDGSVTGGTAGAGVKIAAATITDANVAAANKDGVAGTPSLRTLGTGATQATAGNDARLSNSRPPNGSASGDLAGSYPGPTIAALAVTDAKVAAANKDGAAATPSMRTLGTGATQALAGNTRLDQITAPTTSVSLNSQKIINLADPTADTDAANKRYVDSARAGLRLKDSVRVATTGNIALTGTQTIDGVAVVAGDRVLVKAQTTASANGIYVVAAGAWTRAIDADSAAEVGDGATTFVQQGTAQANTTWSQINTITTLGTDNQDWVQQGAAVNYTAGAGLTQNGSTFDIVAADGSITVNADSVTVGNVPVAKGGTGATTAVAARANLGATGKYAADLGAFTAGSEMSVTHGLGTTDLVGITIKNISTGFLEDFDVRVVDANTIGITSAVAHSSGVFRVVVGG